MKSWNTPGKLIQVDWMAGAVVGAVMPAFRGWLTELYRLPGSLVTVIGAPPGAGQYRDKRDG